MADEETVQPYQEPDFPGEEDPAQESALSRFWGNLPLPARIGIAAVGGLTLVALLFLTLGRPEPEEMQVLFHRLDPVDAGEVAGRLDEMNISYELRDGGTTILVPPDQRDRLRISLSPELYSRGIGFALFEDGAMVASDFERRVQFQIALEEELRRTITSMEAVEQARVHLVMPEEGLFIRDRKEPTASVLLRLSPLVSLTDNQVRGILNLVAGSVDGLLPENVSIVDSRGSILYDAYTDPGDLPRSLALEGNLHLKRQFETELERRLRTVLEQVYGPGRAVAMVSADLDFDLREETSVVYDDNPVPRSTHVIREESENIAPPAEEVGEPNIPGQAAVVGGMGDSRYEREEEIVNYEVSETRQYIEAAPGQVQRLSTAVIIDGDGMDPFVVEQVADLVNSAIGLNEARGDTLSVQMLPFDTTWLLEPEPEPPIDPDGPSLLFWIALGAAGFLLFLVLLLFLILRARARRREEEDFDALDLEEELVARLPDDSDEQEPGEAELRARSIRDMAKEEPETVASLLKTWMAEE